MTRNLNDDLSNRGLTDVTRDLEIYDINFILGGPIRKDRLWFFGAVRNWGNGIIDPGVYWNATQGTPFYTPDLTRPGDRHQWFNSKAIRVTWQASAKNKFNFFVDDQDACVCRSSQVSTAPEAYFAYHIRPDRLHQVTWSAPLTNRLLFEAGAGMLLVHFPAFRQEGVTPNTISITDQGTGLTYNARATYTGNLAGEPGDPQKANRVSQRASVSYVTGSHAFKFGFQADEGIVDLGVIVNGNVNYRFNNRLPNQITQYATPYEEREYWTDLGFYAQDQWKLKRLTLNYGLRFDYFSGRLPAQHIPATPNGWIPARDFAEVKNIPLWKDFDPRFGVAYDLRGDGRTALKFSVGRHVSKQAVTVTANNNPLITSVNSATRTWNDLTFPVGDPRRGNFIPDCNLAIFTANGECLAVLNTNFGKNNPSATKYADDVIHGYGRRPYNWDLSAEVQHQLTPQISVNGGYYRSWYGNFTVTDNTLVTPTDYSPFCVTAPGNSKLPGGGGYQVCGLFDVSPAKASSVLHSVELASKFGDQTLVNQFLNFTVSTRFGSGIRFGGGVDAGRTVSDNCFVVDSPQQELNCHVVTPFSGQLQLKFNGSYPLPYDFVVSGLLQNLSGPSINAAYAASNAEIFPTLGRNLGACGAAASCGSSATVPLLVPQTSFENRYTRLDLRLTKVVKMRAGTELLGSLDLYNILNGSGIIARTDTYGSRWNRPTTLLEARILQFNLRLNF